MKVTLHSLKGAGDRQRNSRESAENQQSFAERVKHKQLTRWRMDEQQQEAP